VSVGSHDRVFHQSTAYLWSTHPTQRLEHQSNTLPYCMINHAHATSAGNTYIYIHMHTCMHTHTYIHIYTYICTDIRVYIFRNAGGAIKWALVYWLILAEHKHNKETGHKKDICRATTMSSICSALPPCWVVGTLLPVDTARLAVVHKECRGSVECRGSEAVVHKECRGSESRVVPPNPLPSPPPVLQCVLGRTSFMRAGASFVWVVAGARAARCDSARRSALSDPASFASATLLWWRLPRVCSGCTCSGCMAGGCAMCITPSSTLPCCASCTSGGGRGGARV